MERRDFEARVHEWLIDEKKYPRTSIQPEAVIAPRKSNAPLRADFAVLDNARSEFVAIIEVKSSRDAVSIREGVSQLVDFRESLAKPFIPLFLFCKPSEGAGVPFEVSQILQDGTQKRIELSEFPEYGTLISGDRSSVKVAREVKARDVVDAFKVVCFILAAVTAVFLALDVFGVLVLSARQMVIASVAAAFLILPFAAKLKLLGVEFERHVPGSQRDYT